MLKLSHAFAIFEAAPGPHGWLADSIFAATGERHQKEGVIQFFMLS